jgi:hypothetical protein
MLNVDVWATINQLDQIGGLFVKKVLLINAHQRYEGFAEGKLNQTLIDPEQEKF